VTNHARLCLLQNCDVCPRCAAWHQRLVGDRHVQVLAGLWCKPDIRNDPHKAGTGPILTPLHPFVCITPHPIPSHPNSPTGVLQCIQWGHAQRQAVWTTPSPQKPFYICCPLDAVQSHSKLGQCEESAGFCQGSGEEQASTDTHTGHVLMLFADALCRPCYTSSCVTVLPSPYPVCAD
jgi:hypothetical protein